MTMDFEMSKTLLTAKILQIAYLVAILIYVIMLSIALPYVGFESIYPLGDPILIITEGVLSIVAVICIALGYLLPRWTIKWYKQNVQGLLSVHIVRSALFEAVAIYGLVLGILGAKWPILLPFLAIAALALILTFPTEEKWRNMIGHKEHLH
ncbi:hypothetical protein ACFLUU_03395 [Chloroflexota bacterium]